MSTEQRRERLGRALEERHLEGAIVSSPASVGYLTGHHPAGVYPCFAVTGARGTLLVAPQGAKPDPGVAVTGYAVPGGTLDRIADVPRLSAAALEAALEQAGLAGRRFGYEEAKLAALYAAVAGRVGTPVAFDGCVEQLRRIKDADELALIAAAVGFDDVGLRAASQAVAAGVSELEVAEAIAAAIEHAAGVPVSLVEPTNGFVSGPRAESAVGPATSRRLELEDLLIVDINPVIRAYKGDLTRTFAVGPATPLQERAHAALVAGLEAAEGVARPGITGGALYAALIGPIVAAGFGPLLANHGGHGLGLDHLERPYVIPAEELPLEAGMVIALEPGVYGPDLTGIRIEENYVVTGSGLELLSRSPRRLIVC